MKHENRGRHNSRFFEVEANEVVKFVMLYSDLFVPYSEKSDVFIFGDDTIKEMAKMGWVYDGTLLKCNLTPEGLREILSSGLFEKVKIQRNKYKYVMKREAA